MSIKNIYKSLAILLGYGLIIGGFIVFGESLEDRVRILDIVVSCVIFTQFVEFLLFPLINMGKPTHKEVGMLGVHFFILKICCALSLAVMVCGMMYQIAFKYQLMGHLIVLFLLLLGRYATLHSGDKVQHIYAKEQHKVSGKLSLINAMGDLMEEVARVKDLAETDRQRLSEIHEGMRYISPSTSVEAKRYDDQISLAIEELTLLMKDVTLNKYKIAEEIDHLQRSISRRKQY